MLQVNKLKGEKYKLIWKDSPDFVRLASKLDCTIVPFAAVGGEQPPMQATEALRQPQKRYQDVILCVTVQRCVWFGLG